MMKKMLVTISGPTCSGKSTLERALLETGKYIDVVTATTRAPREGEVNGVDYHFVSHAEMSKMIAQGQLAEFNWFGEHVYGTLRAGIDQALETSKTPLLIVEPNGAWGLHAYCVHHGIVHTPIWLSVEPEVRAERFLRREARPDARRLARMIEEEPLWRDRMPKGTFVVSEEINGGPKSTAAAIGHILESR